MSMKTILADALENELDALSHMEVGSDEHRATVDSAVKLADRLIEIEKMSDAYEEKEKNRKFDNDLKLTQAKEERIDRIVKNCISVAGIILPIALTVWGTKTSLKFEEEGTITTAIGRGFINKLLPKK